MRRNTLHEEHEGKRLKNIVMPAKAGISWYRDTKQMTD